jgi:crotonobetainyl-CoA:carnitine CoA-transferase CaiB-like acyl-CoA transferase
MSGGALAGLTVLDFSTLLPGPMATLLLAEAGAEVIKIERPQGEDMRGYEPFWGEVSANFALLNRGKRSLALDLKDPAQRARLDPLLARADILVEQFRPGVMDRLGLGYAALSAANPRLIYCSITGYGQTGPKRDVAGHDLNYIGDAGLLALGHGDPQRPVVPPALIADIAGGAYPAVMNILMALRARDATGRGCHIDVAMSEGVFPFLYWAIGGALGARHWPRANGERVTGGSPRYQLYPTADGRIVAAAPLEEKFWRSFCDAIALPAEWRDDARDPAGTIAQAAALIRARPAAHWRAVFAAADCCCSIVATLQEALADPHFAARGVFARDLVNASGARLPAVPVPIDPALRAATQSAAAPALGADNGALLGR